MSLGHGPATRNGQADDSVVQEAASEQSDVAGDSWPALAEEAVPMRDATERELDRDREERVRLVVESGSSRAFPWPPARTIAVGLGGLASVLLGFALISATGAGNSAAPIIHQPATSTERLTSTPMPRTGSDFRAAKLQQAHARRRAAIRAKEEAARRRASERAARARIAAHTQSHSQRSSAEPPQWQSIPASEPTQPPVEPATSAASTPQPTTTTAPTGNQVQREFGFER